MIPDVPLKNKRYRGTQGLYELPKNYSQQNGKKIKQILRTQAHGRYYKANRQIDGSKMWKYKKISIPIGSAKIILSEVGSNNVQNVHWDSADELISHDDFF